MTLSAPENEKVPLDSTASHAVKRKRNDKTKVIFVYTFILQHSNMYRPSGYAGFGFRSRFAQEKTKTTKTFTKYYCKQFRYVYPVSFRVLLPTTVVSVSQTPLLKFQGISIVSISLYELSMKFTSLYICGGSQCARSIAQGSYKGAK